MQKFDEVLYVLRGSDRDKPAWHIVLLNVKKLQELENQPTVCSIDVDKFGRNIYYRDTGGNVRKASGFENEPPEQLLKWLKMNYGQLTLI